jgi:hypothetical protein
MPRKTRDKEDLKRKTMKTMDRRTVPQFFERLEDLRQNTARWRQPATKTIECREVGPTLS